MWMIILLIYAVGLALTARVVLPGRPVGGGQAAVAGLIVLWPAFWAWSLVNLYLNRKRQP